MHHSNSTDIIRKGVVGFILFFAHISIHAQTPILHELDTSDAIDKIALNEFKIINRFYGTNQRINTIYKTDGITKARNHQIEINTRSILERSREFDSIQLTWIVTLVVAHEFIHLIQYENYDRLISDYESKLRESQADILAGEYLDLRIWAKHVRLYDSINPERRVVLRMKIFNDAYKFFFNIGTNTFALEDHPDKNQRATSILRGAFLGELENLHLVDLGFHERENPSVFEINNNHSILNTIIEYKQNLGILSLHDTLTLKEKLDWSYDLAKMIVHGNPESLGDIVKTNETWSRKADTMFIHNLMFKNIGNDTLTFKFEDRLGKSSRDSSFEFEDDFFFFKSFYHTIILYPHELKIITDTCNLNYFSGYYNLKEIKYISPPSYYSLFYCIDHKKETLETDDRDRNLLRATIDSVSLKQYMVTLIDASDRGDYSKIVADMGISYLGNYVKYNGIAPPDTKFTCSLERNINGNWESIELNLGDFKDGDLADSIFNYYCQQFSILYGKAIGSNGTNRSRMAVFQTSRSLIHVFKIKMGLLQSFDNRGESIVTKSRSKLIQIQIFKKKSELFK